MKIKLINFLFLRTTPMQLQLSWFLSLSDLRILLEQMSSYNGICIEVSYISNYNQDCLTKNNNNFETKRDYSCVSGKIK